jgi:hypothetical protein
MTLSNYSSRYYSYVGVKFLTVDMRRTNEHNERFALAKSFNTRPFFYYRRFVDEIIFSNWVQQIKVEYLSSLPIIGHYNKAFLRKKQQRGHDGC